ncbi:MAG TPA: TIGR03435 family protein [Bryobacteraceae bacterium]|jgi:uncharacterized protein (TIGR03435 family)
MAMFTRFIGAQMSSNRGGASNEQLPHIADKTGLAGSWDIDWSIRCRRSIRTSEGPSIFRAVQQQLGLKLQKVKDVPIDVLVIDHIDQTSTEN